MKWDIEDIEYVLSCIDSPDKLNSEEFLGWLEIGEHKKLFSFVLAYREAFLRKEKSKTINVDEEFIKFQKRNTSRRALKKSLFFRLLLPNAKKTITRQVHSRAFGEFLLFFTPRLVMVLYRLIWAS